MESDVLQEFTKTVFFIFHLESIKGAEFSSDTRRQRKMAGDVFYYGDCHFSHDDNVDELKLVRFSKVIYFVMDTRRKVQNIRRRTFVR